MGNYAVMFYSILVTLVASFAATYMGYWLVGFALFLSASTPLPTAVGFSVYDRLSAISRRPQA